MRGGRLLSMAGSAIAVAMPKGVCPLCLGASSTLLSALGIGAAARGSVMRWWLAALLLLGLYAFVWRARTVRRWGALVAAVLGSALVYLGWFTSASAVLYGGMAVLAGASIANWRMKVRRAGSTCHVS